MTTRVRASARVTVTIEFLLPGPYGGDWTLEKASEDAKRSALDHARRLFTERTEYHGRLIDEPRVKLVIVEEET